MKRMVQYKKLQSLFRSSAAQRMAADALQNISTVSIVGCGYLLLFANDSPHAHRLLWVAVLAVDAAVGFICSVDLQQGGGE
jgi:hypothetical protein